jgi:hypothetical protein
MHDALGLACRHTVRLPRGWSTVRNANHSRIYMFTTWLTSEAWLGLDEDLTIDTSTLRSFSMANSAIRCLNLLSQLLIYRCEDSLLHLTSPRSCSRTKFCKLGSTLCYLLLYLLVFDKQHSSHYGWHYGERSSA